jgi:hypothetical protein
MTILSQPPFPCHVFGESEPKLRGASLSFLIRKIRFGARGASFVPAGGCLKGAVVCYFSNPTVTQIFGAERRIPSSPEEVMMMTIIM